MYAAADTASGTLPAFERMDPEKAAALGLEQGGARTGKSLVLIECLLPGVSRAGAWATARCLPRGLASPACAVRGQH